MRLGFFRIFLIAVLGFFTVFTGVMLSQPAPLKEEVVGICFMAAAVLAILMLFDPVRFNWAARILCAAVFAGYLLYAAHSARNWKETSFFGNGLGDASLGNALLGLVIFGLPALAYARRPAKPRATSGGQ
jgi:hypothetical protein